MADSPLRRKSADAPVSQRRRNRVRAICLMDVLTDHADAEKVREFIVRWFGEQAAHSLGLVSARNEPGDSTGDTPRTRHFRQRPSLSWLLQRRRLYRYRADREQETARQAALITESTDDSVDDIDDWILGPRDADVALTGSSREATLFPSEMTSRTRLSNMAVVGEKLLKAVASDFALSWEPNANTEDATSIVATVVYEPHMASVARRIGLTGAVEEYQAFFCVILFVLGWEAATSLLVSCFLKTASTRRALFDIPKLLSYFKPGIYLRDKSHEERVALLEEALREKWHIVFIRYAHGTEDEATTSEGPLDVIVQRLGKADQPVSCKSAQQVQRLILREARHCMKIEQNTRVMKKPKANSTASSAPVPFDHANSIDQQTWMNKLIKSLKDILRLRGEYRPRFEGEGLLGAIIKSNGWIPLVTIRDTLAGVMGSMGMSIIPPDVSVIQDMLENHDWLQRYEVGVSDDQGELAGVPCARAMYAHEIKEPPLHQRIFDTFLPVERDDLPDKYAWVLVSRSDLSKAKRKGWVLFDNIRFVTAVLPQYLTWIVEYRTGPAHLLCDEKVSSGELIWIEADLRVATRCSRLVVRRHRNRNDFPGHYIITIVNDGTTDMSRLPMIIFTGKTCVMRAGSRAAETAQTSTPEAVTPATTPQPLSTEDYLVREKDRSLRHPVEERFEFTDEEVREMLANLGNDSSEDEDAGEDDGTRTGAQEGSAGATTAVLDLQPFMDEIEAFLNDPNEVETMVHIPKFDERHRNFSDRQGKIKDLKSWLASKELQCSETKNTEDGDTVYSVRKPRSVGKSDLEKAADWLGVKFKDLGLLQTAVTHKSINKDDNLEMLEFIGDAVMDLVVLYDAVLVNSPRVEQTASSVLQNDVLAVLLPPVLEKSIEKSNAEKKLKHRADVFEAIIGAMYRDGQGLDEIRRALRTLFSQLRFRAEEVQRGEPLIIADRSKITTARKICPYLIAEDRGDGGEFWESRPLDRITLLTAYQRKLIEARCKTQEQEDEQFYWQPDGQVGKSFFDVVKYWANSGSEDDDDMDDDEDSSEGKDVVDRQRWYDTPNSFQANSKFPRIQNKAFATHFTTGTAYSYSRVPTPMVPLLHNRILRLFNEKAIAYVNETLLDVIHLVIDFDGEDVRRCGVLGLIWEWYAQRFGSPAAGILLDCSGPQVTKKNAYKNSFHIHFPQIPIPLGELAGCMEDVRNLITRKLVEKSMCGCDVYPGMICFAEQPPTPPDTTPSVQDLEARSPLLYRVILSTSLVQKRSAQILRDDPPDNRTAAYQMLVWRYVDLPGLYALSRTSRSVRRSVTLHLAALASDVRELARVAGVNPANIAEAGGGAVPYAVVRVVTPTLFQWSLAAATRNEEDSPAPADRPGLLMLIPESQLTELRRVDDFDSEDVPQLKNAIAQFKINMAQSKAALEKHPDYAGKACKVNVSDYREKVLVPLMKKGTFNKSLWDQVMDPGLVGSRKLRMYLCDKFDMIYNQEFRPLFFSSLLASSSAAACAAESPETFVELKGLKGSPMEPLPCPHSSVTCCSQCSGKDTAAVSNPTALSPPVCPVEMSHASSLRLTSLHAPQYRDCYGDPHLIWDEVDLDGAQLSVESTATNETSQQSGRKWCPSDLLVSFEELQRESWASATDWRSWMSNCCQVVRNLPRKPGGVLETKKTPKLAAALPSYWLYDTANQQKTLYIAAEPCLCVTDNTGRTQDDASILPMVAAAREAAHFLLPHVKVEETMWKLETVELGGASPLLPMFDLAIKNQIASMETQQLQQQQQNESAKDVPTAAPTSAPAPASPASPSKTSSPAQAKSVASVAPSVPYHAITVVALSAPSTSPVSPTIRSTVAPQLLAVHTVSRTTSLCPASTLYVASTAVVLMELLQRGLCAVSLHTLKCMGAAKYACVAMIADKDDNDKDDGGDAGALRTAAQQQGRELLSSALACLLCSRCTNGGTVYVPSQAYLPYFPPEMRKQVATLN